MTRQRARWETEIMKVRITLSASVLALCSAQTAQAQSAPDTAGPDEIVVTAERRAVSAQRTGVAATVLTGEDLVRKGVNSVQQLQFATPSLTVNTSGQGNSFNIRGIGKSEITSSIGVGVITYRDGVATFPGYFQGEPYYDLASVEVLRGPQGTFAGGNATGGAVFITEAAPNFNGGNGFASAQYGNYNGVRLQGAVNLPVSDTLSLRLATSNEWRDTFYDISGPWTGNPGDLRSHSARASVLWQPTSQLRVLLKGDYNNIEMGGYPASPATATHDPFDITSNAHLSGRDHFGRIVLNVSYTLDSGMVLRSISGWQNGRTKETIDYDGTSTAGSTFLDDVTEEIWSQEINLVSPDTGPLTWVLGAYYQHDEYTFPGGGYLLTQPGSYDLALEGSNPHTALAGFGQVAYKLANGLELQFGARWSGSTSRNDATYTIPQFGLLMEQSDFTSDKKLTGKAALNWTLNPDHFLYAFVATGHKAGGLNGLNLAGVPALPFKPEGVTDYEIGWKATWFGGQLRTQVGAYYNRYRNFQVSIVDPRTPAISSIFNVADPTTLYGAEVSAQGSFGALGFDLAASASHSSLGRFFASDPRIATPATCDSQEGPETARCIDLEGRRQSYSPKFTLSAGLQYAIALGADTTLTPRVDYAHIASAWGTLFQDAARGDRLEARDILNAQLTLESGPWSIAGYGTNLTNQHYIDAFNGLRRIAGAPRQYGIRVNRTF
jgi:iron complex outermembrane receptor protein